MSSIGVFDSGVGGLTVVAALERRMPQESILYLGDTARLPYGTKSAATVTRYTQRNIDFLLARDVKAVIVACNTASALALSRVVPHYHGDAVPLFGVIEPGAAEAVRVSRGHVGIIATESTVRSDAYAAAIRRRAPALTVRSAACPLFVPLVEEGWQDDPITRAVAARYLAPLLTDGLDTLVLGCTHYPLLRPLLREIVGADVVLVDSAVAVADQVAAELGDKGLLGGVEDQTSHFCLTDSNSPFQQLASTILGRDDLSFELVDVS
ncbi:MAG: glutamate racemase [Acidobacteria bacterium]|nr:glutamate racemase [Acidobacteriota bacterium]